MLMDIFIQTVTLLFLLGLSAFFSSAETALTTVSNIRLRTMAEGGNKKAARVLKVTDDTPKMLSAILIGNNVVNISASSLATILAIRLFGSYGAGIATGVMTLLVLLFGEITPKYIAARQSIKVSLRCSGVIYTLMVVLTPVIWVVNHLVSGILRILRADRIEDTSSMTEEEFRTIIDVGSESGAIEDTEKDYINNLFDFSDTKVKELMIPKIDVTMVSTTASYEKIRQIYVESMYTRLPVYEEDSDHIIGILNMKDLLLKDPGSNFSVKRLLRKPYYTYEFKRASDLFHDMRRERIHLAIVQDEYGDVTGIVTMEDLLEELVGEIRDEYDANEEDDLIKESDTDYTAMGTMNLDDLCRQLDLPFTSEDYDTIGGYLLGLFDHFPKAGESYVSSEGIILSASTVRRRRIVRVHIHLPRKEQTEEKE
ncbi:MAG: hemolysin family protein [Lachnospiraceae bacterium]|nr:HlyC/CorC family transporter [Lachnospiraceae bacterium]MCR4731606.1 hemolysin family protein [Lachnospiraceae bacterium]